MAKVWQLTSGHLSNLRLNEIDLQVPAKEDDILIQVAYSGLNFADIFACLGLYSATPKGLFTPGLEFSGVVVQVHENNRHNFKIGDRVMGVTRFGGYGTQVLTTDAYIRHLPEGWDLKEGACFLCQALTAWYGLVQLGTVQPRSFPRSRLDIALGDKIVLIQSAAGGVGLWALNICNFSHAFPIAVVGSEAKKKFLMENHNLKEPQIIVRTADVAKFEQDIKLAIEFYNSQENNNSRKREGVDVVFDAVSGDYFQPSYRQLARGGKYVIYGAAQYMDGCGDKPNYFVLAWKYMKRPKIDPGNMITENKSVLGFNLIWMWDQVELMRGMLDDMFHPDNSWNVPVVGKIFNFENALDALQYLQTGTSIGKVLLEIEPKNEENKN